MSIDKERMETFPDQELEKFKKNMVKLLSNVKGKCKIEESLKNMGKMLKKRKNRLKIQGLASMYERRTRRKSVEKYEIKRLMKKMEYQRKKLARPILEILAKFLLGKKYKEKIAGYFERLSKLDKERKERELEELRIAEEKERQEMLARAVIEMFQNIEEKRSSDLEEMVREIIDEDLIEPVIKEVESRRRREKFKKSLSQIFVVENKDEVKPISVKSLKLEEESVEESEVEIEEDFLSMNLTEEKEEEKEVCLTMEVN
jgi:hypothetical protein